MDTGSEAQRHQISIVGKRTKLAKNPRPCPASFCLSVFDPEISGALLGEAAIDKAFFCPRWSALKAWAHQKQLAV
jgi:hypothetical protein